MIRLGLAALLAVTIAVVLAGFAFGSPRVLEAWLLVFLILTGFAAASLGLLMIGHLLGDRWLMPVRDELEPASWTLPVLALLALPLAAGIELLYPWASDRAGLPPARSAWLTTDWFLLRGVLYLALWAALALLIARAGPHRAASAAGLALLAGTFSLASVDWVMSREPHWWSSLFGFAFAVSQLLAGLAAAVLVTTARQSHPGSEELESLERALLTLALLTAWVWFAQFLVVWMANLPDEALWYLRRRLGWSWLSSGIVVPALALAIVLLIPSHFRRWRVVSACLLILVHHIAHMIWLIRPPSGLPALTLADATVSAGVGGVWALWFAVGLRYHGVLYAGGAAPSGARDAERQRG